MCSFARSVDGAVNAVLKLYDRNMASLADADGGTQRGDMGTMVERMTELMVGAAWQHAGGSLDRIEVSKTKVTVPLNKEYITRIPVEEVREHVAENRPDYTFDCGVDRHLYVDGRLVLVAESKAYMDNTMIRRTLFDMELLCGATGDELICLLVQLENGLGGDYGDHRDVVYGSESTHTILSYFPIYLHVVTLLSGKRSGGRPIHDPVYSKEMKPVLVRRGVEEISELLSPFV